MGNIGSYLFITGEDKKGSSTPSRDASKSLLGALNSSITALYFSAISGVSKLFSFRAKKLKSKKILHGMTTCFHLPQNVFVPL